MERQIGFVFPVPKPVEGSADPSSRERWTLRVGVEADDDREIGGTQRKELGGPANQDRQHLIRIDIVDLKGARVRSFARSCPRRVDGS